MCGCLDLFLAVVCLFSTRDKRAAAFGSAPTIDVFVPLPQHQRSQQQQQQADAHAAHYQACVVLLLSQRHLAQMSDGVRLPPLEESEGSMSNSIRLHVSCMKPERQGGS